MQRLDHLDTDILTALSMSVRAQDLSGHAIIAGSEAL